MPGQEDIEVTCGLIRGAVVFASIFQLMYTI